MYVNSDRIITALPWNISIGDTLQLDIPSADEQPEYLFDVVHEKLTHAEAKEILAKHARDIEHRKNRQKSKAIAKKQCMACVSKNSTYPHCPIHCSKAKLAGSSSSSSRTSNNNDRVCLCSIHRKTPQRTKLGEDNTQGAPPSKRLRQEVEEEQHKLREQLAEEAKKREAERYSVVFEIVVMFPAFLLKK